MFYLGRCLRLGIGTLSRFFKHGGSLHALMTSMNNSKSR
jgi:hypothetical protein